MYQDIETFLRRLSADLLDGCRVSAHDGTRLYTPDGVGNYGALWLRDFAYMVEYAGELIPEEDIVACIRYAIRYRREDGWLPDRALAQGRGIYAAGVEGGPIGEANLDNAPFLVYTAYALAGRMDAQTFAPLLLEWYPHLAKGLDLIPLDENGLVYNAPGRLHSPYGFTDTVAKAGSLFMESLLLWRAAKMMADLTFRFPSCTLDGAAAKDPSVKKESAALHWENIARRIECGIFLMKGEEPGSWIAAAEVCRQIDIWGMAYLLYIGFPLPEEDRRQTLRYLRTHADEYIYEGQIRHLLQGEYWEALLIPIDHETYQNGAYWATASGWVIWCLAQTDPAFAGEAASALTVYLKEHGTFECVGPGYQKLPLFVVSAANSYAGLVRTAREVPAFRDYLDKGR